MFDLLRQILPWSDSRASSEIPASVPETLAHHSLAGAYLIQNGTFRYVNDGLSDLLGYDPEELVDRLGPKTVTHPEDWPDVEENLRRRLEGEVDTVRYGFRVLTKSDSVRYVEIEGSRVEHEGRAAIAGIMVDVTERQRSFRRLRENRDLLRRSQRVARIGGWEYDPQTDTARGTKELYHILDLPVGEGFTLETGLDFYAPPARPLVAEAIERCMEEGTPFDHEVPLVTAEEERKWVRVRGQAEFEGDQLIRLTGTLQDVTERREAERALELSRNRLQRLVENLPQIVFILDDEGTLLVSEGGDLQALDVAPGEHVGQSVYDLYADYPEMLGYVDRALDGESIDEVIEIEGVTLDVWYAPYCDENDEVAGCLGMAVDVTERREREEELRTTKQEAEEASDLKSALLANMSHEFRTPLSSIIGFAELMEERADGPFGEWAESIRTSGERLHDTLDEVLCLAQLEGGELGLVFEPVRVPDLVEEPLRLMEAEAQRKGVTLDVEIRDLDVPVVLSPTVLDTSLSRLVHNAIKFTEEGNVHVEICRQKDSVVLRVDDTGTGISEEARERIYEPFYQASQGISRRYEGAGLGLTIVQRLVDRAGGRIQIESEEGRGTEVIVTLPVEKQKGEVPAAETPGEATMPTHSDWPSRLLVVEDDEGMRALVREMLAPEIEVREAGDPETAKARAEEETFDAVLLDINLRSSVSGTDLIAPIQNRQNGERAPRMIAMTAYAMPGDRERFLEQGFDDYISKPFTRELLREKLSL